MTDSGQLSTVKPDPMVGQLFVGKYEILSVLGQGGMGVVYKARHVHMDQLCAIKMLVPGAVTDNSVLRFKQEARAVSALRNHSNIITIFDFGVSDVQEQAYLVMEYLPGRTLEDIIVAEEPIPVDRFLHIFSQVCSGMQYAHKKGCVHRDLKPSNIMVLNTDEEVDFVKILDFGLAKPVESEQMTHLTKSGMVIGSPPFMSPEQCKGETIDFRSDIYSLGCVMYATLTGEVPLMGTNTMATLFKHISDVPRSIRQFAPHLQISQQLDDVVMRTLEKDPGKRHQSMKELEDDLALAVRGGNGHDRGVVSHVVPAIAEPLTSPAQRSLQQSLKASAGRENLSGGADRANTRSGAASVPPTTSRNFATQSQPQDDTRPVEREMNPLHSTVDSASKVPLKRPSPNEQPVSSASRSAGGVRQAQSARSLDQEASPAPKSGGKLAITILLVLVTAGGAATFLTGRNSKPQSSSSSSPTQLGRADNPAASASTTSDAEPHAALAPGAGSKSTFSNGAASQQQGAIAKTSTQGTQGTSAGGAYRPTPAVATPASQSSKLQVQPRASTATATAGAVGQSPVSAAVSATTHKAQSSRGSAPPTHIKSPNVVSNSGAASNTLQNSSSQASSGYTDKLPNRGEKAQGAVEHDSAAARPRGEARKVVWRQIMDEFDQADEARLERDYERAIKLFTNCLAKEKEFFGGESPKLLRTIGRLADCYLKVSNIMPLEPDLDLAITIYKDRPAAVSVVNQTTSPQHTWVPLGDAFVALALNKREPALREVYLKWAAQFYDNALSAWNGGSLHERRNVIQSYLRVARELNNPALIGRLIQTLKEANSQAPQDLQGDRRFPRFLPGEGGQRIRDKLRRFPDQQQQEFR